MVVSRLRTSFATSSGLWARQFQPETPLHGGVAGADLDQQLGQTLDSERLKVR